MTEDTLNLAAQLGDLDVQIKRLEAQAEKIKTELKARKIDTVTTAAYVVTRSETVRCALDVKLVQEDMGEAWVTKHSKFTPVQSIRVTIRKDALVAI